MRRRRLWEVTCFSLDALLCTSFDPDELVALDAQFPRVPDIPECSAAKVPRSLVVYGVAHKACHSENPVSRKIETRLDALYERTLRECERAEPAEFLAKCYDAAEEAREDLGGCLWALVTDPRRELREQGLFWLEGVVIRSLLHWMRSWKEFRRKEGEREGEGRDGSEGTGG